MARKRLYQTLRDKGNPEEVNANGPFPCKWENTWLGDGYYFWDHFYDNAMWWGENRYDGNCIICVAYCDYNTDRCFDLVGTVEHLDQFKGAINLMKLKGLYNNKTTVKRVLNFMRKKVKTLKHEAVRVYGVNTIAANNKVYADRLFFEVHRGQYLDVTPAIQICIFEKDGLDLKGYEVVFPSHYIDGNMFI